MQFNLSFWSSQLLLLFPISFEYCTARYILCADCIKAQADFISIKFCFQTLSNRSPSTLFVKWLRLLDLRSYFVTGQFRSRNKKVLNIPLTVSVSLNFTDRCPKLWGRNYPHHLVRSGRLNNFPISRKIEQLLRRSRFRDISHAKK